MQLRGLSPSFPRLLVGTTLMTYVLMLLGVYTAAFGAGLTCGANWPLCDGAVFGLFPANVPSFIEWFHRLFAIVTGFVIVGAAVAAWRSQGDDRVKWAVTAAVVLLPAQILLGGGTVLLYEELVLISHFVAALAILGLLTYATVRTVGRPAERWVRLGAVAAPVLAVVQYLVSYGGPLLYTQEVQTFHYAVTIALFGLVLTVALWTRTARRTTRARAHYLFAVGTVLVAALLILGRRVWGQLDLGVTLGLSAAAVAVLAAATWVVLRSEPAGGGADQLTGDAS